jgi:hypothetical protein
MVTIGAPFFPADIACTDVTPSKTVVGQGYSLNINVTVENQGDSTETFGVVAPYFEGVISPTSENWETFWSMGDVNLDGYINQTDVNIISYNWGWHGPPGENAADITSDGWVDAEDMVQCAYYQGENIWTYFGLPLPPKGTQRGVRLCPDNQITLAFTWNTTSFAKGNYTIKAYAWPVTGENATSDNTLADDWVVVTIPGDIDGSFSVDGGDLGLLGLAWYSKPRDPNWNPNADLNNDGLVDGGDLGILGFYWFQTA